MKKTNLIINIVLILALTVLYILHFTTEEKAEPAEKPTAEIQKTGSHQDISLPIAYVNIDTLLANMQMYEDLTEKLTSQQQRLETEFTSKYRGFEREITDFQEKVQKGLLTRREAQELESQLTNRRMELENQRNDYLMELQEENMVAQNKVIDYIMDYLEEYNSNGTYRYILSYSFGGAILYATEALNITNEVLRGINDKYAAEQE
ncbi:MAG: OmpH family outer membrane protein [Bacteroidota bacterium]